MSRDLFNMADTFWRQNYAHRRLVLVGVRITMCVSFSRFLRSTSSTMQRPRTTDQCHVTYSIWRTHFWRQNKAHRRLALVDVRITMFVSFSRFLRSTSSKMQRPRTTDQCHVTYSIWRTHFGAKTRDTVLQR